MQNFKRKISTNLAKLGDGRGLTPTVTVVDIKQKKLGRNRGIPKTQKHFTL
jgi:hypothetical protein